jgi:hypothetical protein
MLVVFIYVFVIGHYSCLGIGYLLEWSSRQAPILCEL